MNDDEPLESANPEPSEIHESVSATWVPPTTEKLQQLLPQFEVLELIARGGMGAVYKARQLSLDRLVAIKLLPPEALNNGDINHVERFKNEARLMARLNHPDIVTVHDFGETIEGHLYFIMEFVDGTDVSRMIESQGRLPPQYALAITAHVCDALQYAHTHGVIHHDIKPGNVLINMEGEVKVADFGIASMGVANLVGLTEITVTLGTPDYIAPEALTIGVEVDRRADLYSVGVMLYHMLTGALPQGEYQPASVLAGSDVRYDAIIARALQYDRELRFQSARELRRDLDDIIATPVIKEGDVTGRAAIPKQFVHRRAVNAPVYRPPAAPSYTEEPVPRNYVDVFWFMIIVAVLAGGVYVWKKQERYKQSLPKTPIVAAPRQQPSAPDVKPPSNSQDPVVGNRPGKPDSPTSSPSPQQPSSGSDIASGTWTVVHDAQGGSKRLASRDVNFGPECRDGAIRATVAANASSKDWVHVELRCDKEGNRYDFILKPTGFAVIGYLRSGAKGEVVKQVGYDASIRRSEYTIELRAVGRKLTGSVNGVEMLSVEDDRISSGCFGIESKFLDSYREVAYLSLDQSNSSQNITAAPVSSAPGTDSRLPKIEAEFREAYDRDIIRPHEVAVADLNTKYLAALGRADAAAIQSGKSDESLRLKEEIQRVQNKQPIPATEVESVPASLKQLRATYDGALAKIGLEWDTKSRVSYDQMNRQLEELQKSLLEEGHTDEAQLIKTKRDQIADNITRP